MEANQVDSVLMAKKVDVFLDLIDLFADFMDPKAQRAISQNPRKAEALGRTMAKLGITLSLVGSPEVVRSYVKFRLVSQGGASSDTVVDCFADIVRAMRDDLHGADTGAITRDDILGTFVTMDGKELENESEVM